VLIQFIILQVLVFGVIIFFIKKILTKDAQSAETQLNQVYEELLEKQKVVSQQIEEAEKELIARREEAASVVSKLKKEAQAELVVKEDAVMKEAKAQADEMVQKSRAAADDLRRRLQKEESAKVLSYAAMVVQQSLSENVIAVLHRQMVKEFIHRGEELDFSNVNSDVAELKINSALPLTEEEKSSIDALIKKKLKRELKSQEFHDEKLIAGVTLEFGTLLLDGCFASAINDTVLAQKKLMQEES